MNSPIVETELFKSVAPKIAQRVTPGALEVELAVAAASGCKIRWEKDNLDTAIEWARTPQGGGFWSELHNISRLG